MSTHCGKFDYSLTRRDWLSRLGLGVGGMALASLLGQECVAANATPFQGILDKPHFPPKAKRIIYLFMSGGPSQLDLFDYRPLLEKMHGQNLPESVRMGQRLTGMSANQATFPLVKCPWKFAQHGESGAWVSALLPWTAKMVDKLAWLRGCYTEHINHDPAITFFQTGSPLAGRPSIGSWLSYGLGSANQNLPAFVVLISKDRIDQPLYARLWGNGFLPSIHQGVQFRSGKDPVLYLANPAGVTAESRRKMLDRLAELNAAQFEEVGDPEITGRVAQYEMAYRMQTSVPEVMDLSNEPESTFELYGAEAKTPGTFAANCLLARRLAERDVRFIQLYHPGWDHHGNLPKGITKECNDVDQAGYALVTDLEQRGLLNDTLVVWGGEFGRTNYCQGKLGANDFGRDHHPRSFTMWMAGGGIKPGATIGQTDDFGYNTVEGGTHVHDIQATLLHLLGIDHERLTYQFQGRRYRLTDVYGKLIDGIMA
jgi:Protein of unknown function (DUF1501)